LASDRASALKWAGALGLLLLVIGGLFGRALDYPFLRWDDGVYVTQRPALQRIAAGEPEAALDLLSPKEALDGRFWEYYPLRDLTYAIDAYRGSLSPRPFHQTNLLLHLLCTLLVYLAGRGLGLPRPGAWVASAFFAIHPLTVEPVAWVSARKDLLYSCCVLAALAALLAWGRARSAGRNTIAAPTGLGVMTIAAFASKGPGVITPFVGAWVGYRRNDLPAHRRLLWLLLVLALIACAVLALALVVGQRSQIITEPSAGVGQRAWRALGTPAYALSRITLPIALSPSARETTTLYGWATLGLLLLALLLWRRRPWHAELTTIAGCALFALLPTSGLIQVSQLRADRFLYLPLAFVTMLGVRSLLQLARSRPRTIGVIVVAWLALLGWQTHGYLARWSSDVALWKHALKLDPEHPIANGQLAATAIEQGEFALAKRLLDRALANGSHVATTWSNLGRWWRYQADSAKPESSSVERAEMLKQAEVAFQRAVAIDPRHSSAWTQLGILARERQEPALAEKRLRRALELPRCPLEAALTLRELLLAQGRRREALRVLAEACRQHPLDQRCHTPTPPPT
jgi:hypothetical protein